MDLNDINAESWMVLPRVAPQGLSEEQRALRRMGITATEISALNGTNPYTCAGDVFDEKFGLKPNTPPNPFMVAGLYLEPIVALRYAHEMQLDPEELHLSKTLVHPDYPWVIASPDRVVTPAQGGEEYLLECKTASAYAVDSWGDAGTEAVPKHYYDQVQWQMLVRGWKRADVAVLIGGNDFRIYPIAENPEHQERLLAVGRRFYEQHMQTGIRPTAEEWPMSDEYLLRRRQKSAAKEIATSDALDRAFVEAERVKRQIKLLEAEQARHESILKDAFAEGGVLTTSQGDRVTWDAPKEGNVAWKDVAMELGADDAIQQRHRGIPSPKFVMKASRQTAALLDTEFPATAKTAAPNARKRAQAALAAAVASDVSADTPLQGPVADVASTIGR